MTTVYEVMSDHPELTDGKALLPTFDLARTLAVRCSRRGFDAKVWQLHLMRLPIRELLCHMYNRDLAATVSTPRLVYERAAVKRPIKTPLLEEQSNEVQ